MARGKKGQSAAEIERGLGHKDVTDVMKVRGWHGLNNKTPELVPRPTLSDRPSVFMVMSTYGFFWTKLRSSCSPSNRNARSSCESC